MGNGGKFYRALLAAFALLGLVWIVLVGIAESGEKKMAAPPLNSQPTSSFDHVEVMRGREKLADLNYMSKRRVPNGPDPIHNRRAGNSRQPPGQA